MNDQRLVIKVLLILLEYTVSFILSLSVVSSVTCFPLLLDCDDKLDETPLLMLFF